MRRRIPLTSTRGDDLGGFPIEESQGFGIRTRIVCPFRGPQEVFSEGLAPMVQVPMGNRLAAVASVFGQTTRMNADDCFISYRPC